MLFRQIKKSLLLSLIAIGTWTAFPSNANTVLQTSEYVKKTNELRGLETKIKDAESRIQANLQAKAHATTTAAEHEAMNAMIKAHEELKNFTRDYNKVRMELKYKFPGKGEEIEGHYKPKTIKSIDEIDHSSSLDAQLTKTKRTVEKKLRPISGPVDSLPPHSTPAEEQSHEEDEQHLRLEK